MWTVDDSKVIRFDLDTQDSEISFHKPNLNTLKEMINHFEKEAFLEQISSHKSFFPFSLISNTVNKILLTSTTFSEEALKLSISNIIEQRMDDSLPAQQSLLQAISYFVEKMFSNEESDFSWINHTQSLIFGPSDSELILLNSVTL